MFFVSLGGFDNHGDQFDPNAPVPILAGLHANLLTQVDDALKAFYDATVELGVANDVTTFTMSDFGRALNSNGMGSDHGWGAHQLVMGGAVSGGALYGTFPTVATGTGTDVGQGRLLPTTSIEEYGATFAKWMGVSDTGRTRNSTSSSPISTALRAAAWASWSSSRQRRALHGLVRAVAPPRFAGLRLRCRLPGLAEARPAIVVIFPLSADCIRRNISARGVRRAELRRPLW